MDNNDSSLGNAGKKIFFLYPTTVVQNRIITELAQQEYEVYVSKDKDALRRVLKKYPDSVVFIDINEKMSEKEWEAWILTLLGSKDTNTVSVGIVTSVDDEMIKRKYLLSVKVRCGYTVLKFDPDKAVMRIVDALKAIDARGRRKFLRASTEKDTNATINLPHNGIFISGRIRDISVVGLSCTFEEELRAAKNTLIKDIQIKLQSSLLKVEAIVLGSRMEGHEKIYVLLFTQRIDPDVRSKIRKYIQLNLQSKMNAECR